MSCKEDFLNDSLRALECWDKKSDVVRKNYDHYRFPCHLGTQQNLGFTRHDLHSQGEFNLHFCVPYLVLDAHIN